MNDVVEARLAMPIITSMLDNPKTLYCNCPIDFKGDRFDFHLSSCTEYKVHNSSNILRATRIEIEHVFTAYELGHDRRCWLKGQRQNCSQNDSFFAEAEGDLHNIFPSVGEVNLERSNYAFTDDLSGKSGFGGCEMLIDRKKRLVEPPDYAKGAVARAMFYMSETYKIPLKHDQRKLFFKWDKSFPPDSNECFRDKLIFLMQGNHNHLITEKCKALNIDKKPTKAQKERINKFLKALPDLKKAYLEKYVIYFPAYTEINRIYCFIYKTQI